MVSDNSDTRPFSSNTIADCHPISIDLYSGFKAGGKISSSWGLSWEGAMCPAGRLFEYKVES